MTERRDDGWAIESDEEAIAILVNAMYHPDRRYSTWQERKLLAMRAHERDPDRAQRIWDVAGAQAEPAIDGPGRGFMSVFNDGGRLDPIPEEVAADISEEMYEACRAAAMEGLTNYARSLVPVVLALEEFTIDEDRRALTAELAGVSVATARELGF